MMRAALLPVTQPLADVQTVYERLVAEYHTPILNYLYRLTNDPALAEDLTQEAFTRAWKARDQLPHLDNPRAWLYRIATNAARDQHRRNRLFTWLPLLGTEPAPTAWHGAFDGILLDVPCSNSGVIRRRVDVRWRLQPQDIDKITETQRKILENALPCLKPGGRIVYSTCSIEAQENHDLVTAFLADHPELKLTEERIILPFQHGTDGAYAARIQKA